MTLFHTLCKKLSKYIRFSSIVVFIARLCEIQRRVSCGVVVMRSIPCTLDERPEPFYCVGMYPIRFPLLTPVLCFMLLHNFTDIVICSKLIRIEFSLICVYKLLDKLSDCFRFDVFYELSDNLSTSFYST